MRWEDLFADLEQHWDALAEGERQAETAERARAEYAAVTLLDRFRGAEGRRLLLRLRGGAEVAGDLARVGADFVLLTTPHQECVVPVSAVVATRGLGAGAASADDVGPVRAGLGLGWALRRVAADRSVVTVLTLDARTLRGTLRRVGADFVEVVEHAVDEGPGGPAGRTPTLVPFAAVTLLRREVASLDG